MLTQTDNYSQLLFCVDFACPIFFSLKTVSSLWTVVVSANGQFCANVFCVFFLSDFFSPDSFLPVADSGICSRLQRLTFGWITPLVETGVRLREGDATVFANQPPASTHRLPSDESP